MVTSQDGLFGVAPESKVHFVTVQCPKTTDISNPMSVVGPVIAEAKDQLGGFRALGNKVSSDDNTPVRLFVGRIPRSYRNGELKK